MQQVVPIYVDVLFAINLFVNYFLLLAVSKFLFLKTKRSRLIFAASVGSASSLYILLPEINFFIPLLFKFFVSLVIILFAFGFKNKLIFLKSFLYFYLATFIFLGISLIFGYLACPGWLYVRNSFVYFDVSPIAIMIFTIISFAILEMINRIVGKYKINKNIFCRININMMKKIVSFDAKIDTGLNLKEPFSNLPVIVVNKKIIGRILPENLDFSDLHKVIKGGISARLVPFNTVVGSGLLVAFKPDKIIVNTKDGPVSKEGYVAVCPSERLCGEAALVGFDIIN